MLGVWLCFVVLPSFCLMAAKALKPCVGLLPPSPPCCRCCQDAQFDQTEVFIRMMIQVPPLVSAKLPYCYSNVIGAAFSAPVLLCHPGTPLLVVWFPAGLFGFCSCWVVFCCVALRRVWCDLLYLCYPPLPSLRREASGA